MNRRNFLLLTAAITLVAPEARAASGVYSAEAVAADLKAGRVVVLDFTASWCPSCQSQGRKIIALRAENPGYDKVMSFYDVDWDTYKGSDLATQYGVRSRGSIVVLKGDQVLEKTDTHSSKDALKAIFDEAAASA